MLALTNQAGSTRRKALRDTLISRCCIEVLQCVIQCSLACVYSRHIAASRSIYILLHDDSGKVSVLRMASPFLAFTRQPLLSSTATTSSEEGQKSRRKKGGEDRAGQGIVVANRYNIFAPLPVYRNKRNVTQAAVKQSLFGGDFIDTKFYTFSRRSTSGSVDRLKPVYANSTILKASSTYFDKCECKDTLRV